MKREQIKNLTLTAMFLAIGYVLPFLTMNNMQLGNAISPMHFPVFLCALVCGWKWAVPMAAILPIFRSLTVGAPPILRAIPMAFELATYAFVAGFIYVLLYKLTKRKNLLTVYISLIFAMLLGRVVLGCAKMVMYFAGAIGEFTFNLFMTEAFVNAWPGIILQLVLIPAIMLLLDKLKLVKFDHEKKEKNA